MLAPVTQDVADTIANLIQTKAGERPVRTVSGLDFGTIDLNAAYSTNQKEDGKRCTANGTSIRTKNIINYLNFKSYKHEKSRNLKERTSSS